MLYQLLKPSNKTFIIILTGAVISSSFVFFSGNKYYPGSTYDSINYIYAGLHFFEFGSLLRPGGKPYMEWAPGYPLIIAFLRCFGKNIERNIFVFNCLLIGGSVFLIGKATFSHFNNLNTFILFFISIVFGTPIVLDFHFVWSEGAFIFLSVFLLHFLFKYSQEPHYKYLPYLIVIGAFLSLERQATIFFLPGVALSIFFTSYKVDKRAIVKTFLFYLFASLPTILWVARNKIISGNVMPNYDISNQTSFFNHIVWHHDIVTSWLMPDELPLIVRIIIFYSLLMAIIFLYFNYIINFITNKKIFLISIIIFTSYFLLTFIFCSWIGHPASDEERILSLVYLFGMLSFFLLIDFILKFWSSKLKVFTLVLLCLWTVYPITRCIHNVIFWHNIPKSIPLSSNRK